MPSINQVEQIIINAQRACNKFNDIPEGSKFKYWPLRHVNNEFSDVAWFYARTNGQAFVSGHGKALISIEGEEDCVPIDNLDLVE